MRENHCARKNSWGQGRHPENAGHLRGCPCRRNRPARISNRSSRFRPSSRPCTEPLVGREFCCRPAVVIVSLTVIGLMISSILTLTDCRWRQVFRSASGDADVLPVELGPHLVGAMDEQVLLVDPVDLADEFDIALRPCRRPPPLGDPIGVRGDPATVLTEHPADRLDPERVAMRVDERDHFWDVASSSAPTKADAASGLAGFASGPARRSSNPAGDRCRSPRGEPRSAGSHD